MSEAEEAGRRMAAIQEARARWAAVPIPEGAAEVGKGIEAEYGPTDIGFGEPGETRYFTRGRNSLFRSRFQDGGHYLDRLSRDGWIEDPGLYRYWYGDPGDPHSAFPDMDLRRVTPEEAAQIARV